MERGPAREAAAGSQQVTQSGALDPAARSRKAESKAPLVPGLEFPRYFTLPGVDPFDEVEWEIRSAVIGNEKGKVVFEQRDVEIPIRGTAHRIARTRADGELRGGRERAGVEYRSTIHAGAGMGRTVSPAARREQPAAQHRVWRPPQLQRRHAGVVRARRR